MGAGHPITADPFLFPSPGQPGINGVQIMRTKVMLIWPWSQQHERTHELFPIGLGYLVANIDHARFEVCILDCALENLRPDSEAFRQRLLAFNPAILGVSWWSLNTPVVEETLAVARALLPNAVLLAGGPHVAGCAETIVGCQAVDYAFVGEAEQGFTLLLDALTAEGESPTFVSLEKIPGLVFRDGQRVVLVPQQFVEYLDLVRGVDYERTRLREYHAQGYYYGAKLQKQSELTAPLMTARGCPFRCTFCMAPTIDGKKIRRHSLQYVVEAVQRLYHEYGVRYIAIIDDNFTIDHKWATSVCNAIADLNLSDLAIGTPNGIPLVAGITKELATAMKRAGWREVMLAPESGSKATLKAMDKPINLDAIPDFIQVFHEVGMKVSAFFIIGYPDETLEDIALTEKFILDTDFDFVGISIFQPLPGSKIYQSLVDQGTIPAGFIPGHYQEVTFPRKNIDNETLRDVYNQLWNRYREHKGMPIQNRAVATIREHQVVSRFS